jgi:hypothetical protein
MADGEALSFDAAKEMRRSILWALSQRPLIDPSWRPIALEINWEDKSLFCAHTGEQIESGVRCAGLLD